MGVPSTYFPKVLLARGYYWEKIEKIVFLQCLGMELKCDPHFHCFTVSVVSVLLVQY
jgi:hypothetical protein